MFDLRSNGFKYPLLVAPGTELGLDCMLIYTVTRKILKGIKLLSLVLVQNWKLIISFWKPRFRP